MRKNFANPEIKVEKFDLGTNIVTLSGVSDAENKVAESLGTDLSTDKSGYVFSINRTAVK